MKVLPDGARHATYIIIKHAMRTCQAADRFLYTRQYSYSFLPSLPLPPPAVDFSFCSLLHLPTARLLGSFLYLFQRRAATSIGISFFVSTGRARVFSRDEEKHSERNGDGDTTHVVASVSETKRNRTHPSRSDARLFFANVYGREPRTRSSRSL